MKLKDEKIIKVQNYSFYRAYVVQGALSYAVFIALLIAGLFTDQWKLAVGLLALIMLLYMGYVSYYAFRKVPFKVALKVGLLKMVTAVSSMFG